MNIGNAKLDVGDGDQLDMSVNISTVAAAGAYASIELQIISWSVANGARVLHMGNHVMERIQGIITLPTMMSGKPMPSLTGSVIHMRDCHAR